MNTIFQTSLKTLLLLTFLLECNRRILIVIIYFNLDESHCYSPPSFIFYMLFSFFGFVLIFPSFVRFFFHHEIVGHHCFICNNYFSMHMIFILSRNLQMSREINKVFTLVFFVHEIVDASILEANHFPSSLFLQILIYRCTFSINSAVKGQTFNFHTITSHTTSSFPTI